ncbi:hypothetical protein C1Y23_34955, partial [Pseudomonas sp. GW460-12]
MFDGTEFSGRTPPPGICGGGIACGLADGPTRHAGSAWLQAGDPAGALMLGVVGGRGMPPGGGLTVAGCADVTPPAGAVCAPTGTAPS